MLNALYSGISGLLSNSEALDVISNNIANVNTIAYKTQSASFEDVLYQTISSASGTAQVGRGSALQAISTDFSEGSFQTTTSSTDLAIGGKGFFIVTNGVNQPFYTRDGQFSFDSSGNLVTANGYYVQGKTIDQSTGTAYGVDGNITISSAPSKPKASTEIDLVVNLQADSAWAGTFGTPSNTNAIVSVTATEDCYPATGTYSVVSSDNGDGTYTVTATIGTDTYTESAVTVGDTVEDFGGSGLTINFGSNLAAIDTSAGGTAATFTASGFNSASPTTTSNYSTSLTVYDSLGTAHTLTVYFRKDSYDETSETSTWNWYVQTESGDSVASGGSGTLTFNANGVLTSGGSAQAMTFNFAGAAAGQVINLGLGSDTGQGASTQYSSTSSQTSYESQDGYPPGTLESVSVSSNGIISGTYSNGQIIQLYQVTLATFSNPDGLKNEGGNLYSATLDSGVAYTTTAGNGGTGELSSNSLEESNVDLATQFSAMIIAQTGYQAASKVITTTNELLQTLMNMKT
jgi:flagellar hook protein FlgE